MGVPRYSPFLIYSVGPVADCLLQMNRGIDPKQQAPDSEFLGRAGQPPIR